MELPLLASLIVFTSCLLAAATAGNLFLKYQDLAQAFAGSCILTLTCLFMLPETFHLVEDPLVAGIPMVCAIVLPMVLQNHGRAHVNHTCVETDADVELKVCGAVGACDAQQQPVSTTCRTDEEGCCTVVTEAGSTLSWDAEEGPQTKQAPKKAIPGDFPKDAPSVTTALLGDTLHNITDGIVIAAAFSTCGTAMGWSVTLGTVIHELVMEVAEYIVLVQSNTMSRTRAMGWIAVTCLGTPLGVLLLEGIDPSEAVLGVVLAVSTGLWIFLGVTLCRKVPWNKKTVLFAILGLCAIVACLQLHEHCGVHGGHEGHEGHDGHASHEGHDLHYPNEGHDGVVPHEGHASHAASEVTSHEDTSEHVSDVSDHADGTPISEYVSHTSDTPHTEHASEHTRR